MIKKVKKAVTKDRLNVNSLMFIPSILLWLIVAIAYYGYANGVHDASSVITLSMVATMLTMLGVIFSVPLWVHWIKEA